MVYKFKFYINHHLHFEGNLQCKRCEAETKNKQRCKLSVCIGLNKCWRHLERDNKVKVKPSLIHGAGKGVFVIDKTQPDNAIIFRADDNICQYLGQIINRDTLIARYDYKTAPYGIQLKEDEYMDGALKRGIGTLLNHRNNPNCRFSVNFRATPNTVNIKAMRNIKNGEELYANYGTRYHFNEDDVEYTTKYGKK
jgi:hypothetical protein